MHWRFVILNKSDCYWQSAIVCLVFKVKKKARQTIYCFTLHCLVIAYYWPKMTKMWQFIHLYLTLPYYAFLLTSTLPQYSFTVQNLLTRTYPAVHHCTGHRQLNHYTQLFSLTRTVCNSTPPHIPTESPRGRCTWLWPALYPTVHHCRIHWSTLYHTERHCNWHQLAKYPAVPPFTTHCNDLYQNVHKFTVHWLVLKCINMVIFFSLVDIIV